MCCALVGAYRDVFAVRSVLRAAVYIQLYELCYFRIGAHAWDLDLEANFADSCKSSYSYDDGIVEQ